MGPGWSIEVGAETSVYLKIQSKSPEQYQQVNINLCAENDKFDSGQTSWRMKTITHARRYMEEELVIIWRS